MSPPFPRVFVIRHGETEWSKSGQHTFAPRYFDFFLTQCSGVTDIPLLPEGVAAITALRSIAVGPGKLLDPRNIKAVLVSPRQRARKTFELLLGSDVSPGSVSTDETVREYDYGEYEGLRPREILARRPGWLAFRDGFPGGESPAELQTRIDGVIARCREIHRAAGTGEPCDILIFSHGHFSRAFMSRWIGLPITTAKDLVSSAGSISCLGYAHRSLDEPCIKAINLHGSL